MNESPTDPIRLYAEYIIDAPDEWTPQFTRSELLPMARAYVAGERLRAAIHHVIESSPGTPDSVKKYLLRELEGSWGEPYERAMVDGSLGHPEAS